MQTRQLTDDLTQTSKIGSSLRTVCCAYAEVIFSSAVDAPTVTITGVTYAGVSVVLHTEATISTTNKSVTLTNAGAYKEIFATVGTAVGDTVVVELVAVYLSQS